MPTKSRTSPQPTKPTFIFRGTVQRVKSATMKEVPIDQGTLVVRVDQVIESPKALAKFAGQEITVQLSGKVTLKPGEQRIFNTVSWIYGESVAVHALSLEPVKRSRTAALGTEHDPVARRAQRQDRERFASADLVVSGKVMSVRLPAESVQQKRGVRTASLGQPKQIKPISEHDPKWREAVVEVDGVHKGKHQKKQVVVRFPASKDVMWYNAPKFQPGQQGYFLLHKSDEPVGEKKKRSTKGAGKAASLGMPVKEEDAYVALDPTDFQPFTKPGGVKDIIDSTEEDT